MSRDNERTYSRNNFPSLSIGLIPMLFLQGVFLVMRKQSEEQI